jgi:hypothetical protein
MKAKEKLTDALLIRKGIKVGLKSTQNLVSGDGRVINLGQVSTLVNELEEAAHFFPPFFVFVFDNSLRIDEQRLQSFRVSFGKLLSAQLSSEVERRLREHSPQTSFFSPEFFNTSNRMSPPRTNSNL